MAGKDHRTTAALGAEPAVSSNIVGGNWRVSRKIGEGSFGVIFEGKNLHNEAPVAVKFEPRKTEAPQLKDEWRAYKILQGCPGIPSVHYFGQEGLHNLLVLDLLGPSLEDLFDKCLRKFSIKTTVQIAKQMISRVQSIHERNHIYRDIKPDNFLMGRTGTRNENVVHVVDFGMAKEYRNPKTRAHIPYRERKALSGTARYMSINTHLGREQSRRDDLEALGHVFVYFLKGTLPWQGLKANTNKQKYEKIGQRKQDTSVEELCEDIPHQFADYLHFCRNMGFEDTPDYDYLRDLLTSALAEAGEVEDGVYDWSTIDPKKRVVSAGQGFAGTPWPRVLPEEHERQMRKISQKALEDGKAKQTAPVPQWTFPKRHSEPEASHDARPKSSVRPMKPEPTAPAPLPKDQPPRTNQSTRPAAESTARPRATPAPKKDSKLKSFFKSLCCT